MHTHAAHSSRQWWRAPVALLLAVALLAAGCGAGAEDGQVFIGERAAPAEEPVATASASTLSSPDWTDEGHVPAYGASLDEFLGADVEATGTAPPEGFDSIEWEDLVPPGFSREEISARFDEALADIEPGSPDADEIYVALQAEFSDQPVNETLDGAAIQLAGFVAPITYVGDYVTEFLLVPYFGACIHVPPPPANQTVMVTVEGEGLTIDQTWGAVWVAGTLTVDGAETDIGSAGYSITGAQTGVYSDL